MIECFSDQAVDLDADSLSLANSIGQQLGRLFERKRADLNHKVTVINELKARQHVPVRIMDVISRAVPERLWLTNIAQRGSEIRVQGLAFNTNAVSDFIKNLDNVPGMTEPVPGQIRRSRRRAGQTTLFDFTVDFKLETRPVEDEDNQDQAAAG